jgi:hypothetical protein
VLGTPNEPNVGKVLKVGTTQPVVTIHMSYPFPLDLLIFIFDNLCGSDSMLTQRYKKITNDTKICPDARKEEDRAPVGKQRSNTRARFFQGILEYAMQ